MLFLIGTSTSGHAKDCCPISSIMSLSLPRRMMHRNGQFRNYQQETLRDIIVSFPKSCATVSELRSMKPNTQVVDCYVELLMSKQIISLGWIERHYLPTFLMIAGLDVMLGFFSSGEQGIQH